jgi:hypothetical protein
MNDLKIRSILRRTELSQYISDSHSKVVEELKLPVAKARVDIAVINGHLHGFEIKSASDTLQRLPSQLTAYSKVFDYLTIVTELKYHERILNIMPEWVGVSVCSDKSGEEEFEVIKPPVFNELKEGFYVAKLLWHKELKEIISEHNLPFNKNKRSWLLCEEIAGYFNCNDLSAIVRAKLKQRINWKIKEGY